MIKILPSVNLTLHTTHSITEIKAILRDNVQKRAYNPFKRPKDKTFEGEIIQNTFKINRVIHYRNSFLPIIHGTFKESISNGTDISISFQLHTLVKVFMTVWLSFAGFAFIGLFGGMLLNNIAFNGGVFVPLGMFLFGFGLVRFGFGNEQKRAQKELISILKAEIIG